jgi:hypothetical protein
MEFKIRERIWNLQVGAPNLDMSGFDAHSFPKLTKAINRNFCLKDLTLGSVEGMNVMHLSYTASIVVLVVGSDWAYYGMAR